MTARSRLLRTASLALVVAGATILCGCAGAAPVPSSSTSSNAPSAPASTSPSVLPAKTLPENGKCVLITAEKAAELLGTTATGTSANHSDTTIRHIDGCAYTSAAGNLGYDVNDYATAGVSAGSIVAQAKSAMSAQPGATPFDITGGDSSVAFTTQVGPKVMARVEVAAGTLTIAINAVTVDEPTARKIAIITLATLLSATS